MGDSTSGPNTVSTNYNTFPPQTTWQTTEVQRAYVLPANGTIANFRVVLDTAPGSGKSYVLTLRKNAGATSTTCTVADAATTCTSATPTDFVAGDRIAIQSVPSGTPAAVSLRVSATFAPTTADQFILPSMARQITTGTLYFVPFGDHTGDATENSLVTPIAGAIKSLHAWCATNVAGGASRVFTARVNDSDTALTCTMGAGASTCSDTSNTVAVAAEDRLATKEVSSGTPGTQDCTSALVWDPTTADRFLLGSLTGLNATPTSGSSFQALVGFGSSRLTATETNITKQAAPAMTIRAIAVKLNLSHGAGSSVAYTLRQNGTNQALTCTIADTATACTATADEAIANDDLLSTDVTVASGTPNARSSRIGYAATIP